MPGFKPWLSLIEGDPAHVYCKICKTTFGSHLNTIKRHAISGKHLKMIENSETPVELDFDIKAAKERYRRKVVEQELKFVAMFPDNFIAYQNAPRLLKSIQNVVPCPHWDTMKAGETKVRNMAVNVIAKSWKLELAQILKKDFFSMIIDESTDKSKKKCLAIDARYVDYENKKILTSLFALPPIFKEGEEAKAGAEQIQKCINNSLEQYGIPSNNVLACSFDNCNTMVGEKKGLKARLQENIPGIMCIGCSCHLIHTCGKHALDVLPKKVITLINNFYNLMQSSNKEHTFENLQKKMDFPVHKIPR